MSFDSLEKGIYSGQPIELYKFTMGLKEYLYTSSDLINGFEYDSKTFLPEVISRSEISQNREDFTGSIQINLTTNNDLVSNFIAGLPETPVGLVIYRLHRSLESDVMIIFIGVVANINFQGYEAIVKCTPQSEKFRRTIPQVNYQSQCNWALYSPACGVNKADFATSSTITGISGKTISITAPTVSPGSNKWINGVITINSTGESKFILSNNAPGNQITISQEFSNAKITDAVTIYLGCQRNESDCKNKFNNISNFMGFSRVPLNNPFRVGL